MKDTKSMNEITSDGEFLIRIEGDVYSHHGHLMYMNNPKIGTVGQMPRGERIIVRKIGTENALFANKQQKVVFVDRYFPSKKRR